MGQQPSNQRTVTQTGNLEPARSVTPNRSRSDFIERSLTPSNSGQGAGNPDSNGFRNSGISTSQTSLASARSPISDVPFKLGDVLGLCAKLNQNTPDVPRLPKIDIHNYRYDFQLERQVLQNSESNNNFR